MVQTTGKKFKEETSAARRAAPFESSATQGCYDPLSYPLFFPKGELGWHPNLPKRNKSWDLALLLRAEREDNPGSSLSDTYALYGLYILYDNQVFLHNAFFTPNEIVLIINEIDAAKVYELLRVKFHT